MTGLIVNSISCHLLDFSPWDGTVLDVLKRETPLGACRQDYPVTFSQNGLQLTMKVHRERLKPNCEPECCCRSITRDKEGSTDEAFSVSSDTICYDGKMTLKVSAEFVKVTCFCKATQNEKLYEDIRAFILPALKRNVKQPKTNISREDRLNVYFVGLDSVSMLNFRRYLPNVQKFLDCRLQAIPLQGLTKVGVNTFPNLVPLLTGRTVSQMHQSLQNSPFDGQPFIWKLFSSLGYITMYSEDLPMFSTSNYKRKGSLRHQRTTALGRCTSPLKTQHS